MPRLNILVLVFIGITLGNLSTRSPGQEDVASPDSVVAVRDLIRTGDYEEAEEELVDLGVDKVPLLLLKARLYRETGRGGEALEFLVKSPSYSEGNPDVLAAAAGLRSERGQLKEAKKELESALKSNSRHLEARSRLGRLLIEGGERDRGRAHLQWIREYYRDLSRKEAQAVTPENYVWMGLACQGLDKFREAYEVMFDSALDLDPGNPMAHLASGDIMLSKYNYPDARSHYKDALKTNPNLAEAHIGLAFATFLDHQYPGNRMQDTAKELDQADFIWEHHPRALRLRGDLTFYDEDWKATEELYLKALARNERDSQTRGLLAALYYVTHRMDDFEKQCRKAATLQPEPAAFYTSLAVKLVERFFYKEGAEFAQKAVRLDPEYWPAYVVLGVNALRLGKEEEGRRYIDKAVEADPYNVWAFNTRALIRHIDKNFSEVTSENFIIRLPRDEKPFIVPYLEPLLERSKIDLERRYEVKVETPITVEDFSRHTYFSARSIGLPGLAASGVCFGRMVTLTTPKAIPGNWGAVAIHELAHVITLQKTGHRVPRWLTEGLSVFEEGSRSRRWTRRYPDEFVEAVHHGMLRPMARIQGAFTKPRFPSEIMLAYYQGGVISRYITETYGFDKITEMLEGYRIGKTTEEVFREVLDRSLSEFDEEFLAYARKEADALGIWPRYLGAQINPLRMRVDDHPKDVDAWVKLGLAYFFTGEIVDAELAIGSALAIDREHPDLAALMGFVKMVQKKTKGAIADLERALTLKSNYRYRVRVALAILYIQKNEAARAIELLKEAIDIHPDGVRPRFGGPNPYYLLAELHLGEDQEAEAMQVLERLLLVDRDDAEVRLKLANYYRTQENWEKVVHVLWDAVYINPYSMDIHRLLAQAYLETEAFGNALRELTILLEERDAPIERIYPDIAWCHLKLGQNDKALDFARRALKMNPTSERAQQVVEELEK